MFKKLRTTTALGAGVMAAALILASCSAGTPAGSPSSETSDGSSPDASGDAPAGDQKLTIAIQSWMGDKLALNDMAAAYEADNDGVTVDIVEYADNQALSTFALLWSKGESDQDIVIVDGASSAVQFVEQKLIIDFNETDLFTGDLAKENFIGEALSYTQLEGNQFAVPLGLEVYNIASNRLILDSAGLLGANGELPEFSSWDDIYTAAEAITNETNQPGMTIQWGPNAVPLLISVKQALDGDLFKEDGTTLTFDTPAMRETFEIWRKGVESGVFSIDTFANKDAGRSNFNAGGLGLLLETASRVPEAGQEIGFENVAVLAMPGSLENGSFGFSAGIIVPTASDKQDLALDFIRTAAMSEAQVTSGQEWGKLPVLTRYFDEIDADWKDDMFTFVAKSVPAPMYNDLPMIQERGKQLLQDYLTGSTDLDTFVKNMEDMIGSADLGH